MGWFNKKKKDNKKFIRTMTIQASNPEGNSNNIIIESMLTGRALNLTIPGTTNAYTGYEAQVDETYRKYNSQSDFGSQQTRTVIDLRTAFISGEGISASAENPQTAKWIEAFIKLNKLNAYNFSNAAKGCEMAGQNVFILKVGNNKITNEIEIKVRRIPYTREKRFKPVYEDYLKDKVIDIHIKTEFGWQSFGETNFVYTRTGGDDSNSYGAITKVGTVLTDLENYDRALKDMRRNNHIFARITPVFETKSDSETTSLSAWLNRLKWTIGKAFIGQAKFHYETPASSTHDNLNSELVATIKTISAVTGAPVHWLGYVDLMSNRSTAESLYEFIKNATSFERVIWEESLYELILKAQELYINAGGTELILDPDFQIRLPLISFANFLDKVRALTIAYADKAISINDYMNEIPGIDPLKTKKDIEEQDKKDQENMIKMGIPKIPNINNTEEDDGNNKSRGFNKIKKV